MIVSDRGLSFALMSAKRRSEPSSRIVWGWPTGTSSRTLTTSGEIAFDGSVGRIWFNVSSTSSRIALATAVAENRTISSPPRTNFLIMCLPRPGLVSGCGTNTQPANYPSERRPGALSPTIRDTTPTM